MHNSSKTNELILPYLLSQDDQFEDVEGVEVLASQLEAARKRFVFIYCCQHNVPDTFDGRFHKYIFLLIQLLLFVSRGLLLNIF